MARIVIIGSGGRLGAALLREYRDKFNVTGFSHAHLDLGNESQLRTDLGALDFDALINAAAFTNVDASEKEREQAFRINAEAPRILAEICAAKGARLLHVSTDYVFDGKKREPYVETDPVDPISAYGEAKRAGEENVLAVDERHLIVRVSWVFGPDRPSFIDQMIQRARESESIAAVADKFSTPTYTRDIAEMLMPILSAATGGADPGYTGILHLANAGECTWQEYAQFALDCCHEGGFALKAQKVGALSLIDMKNWIARRPVYSVLSTAKFQSLSGVTPRPWRDAVREYVRDFVTR